MLSARQIECTDHKIIRRVSADGLDFFQFRVSVDVVQQFYEEATDRRTTTTGAGAGGSTRSSATHTHGQGTRSKVTGASPDAAEALTERVSTVSD